MKFLKVVILFFTLINLSYAAKITDPVLHVGKEAGTDFTILHKDGGYLKKIGTQGDWFFSSDGVLEKKIGSGGGTGGDGGVNVLSNAGAEDGTGDWSTSGGTFTQETYANSVESNTKFFRFVSTVSGQYVEQTLAAFPNYISGGCMADLYYMQGDDVFDYKVIEDIGGTPKELASGSVINLTEWAKAPTITFDCPAPGVSLTLRIESTGSGTIDFDNSYMGSNKGFIPFSSVDVVSANLLNNGSTTTILSESANFINTVNRVSTGRTDITFVSGYFSVAPTVTGQANAGSDTIVEVSNLTNTGVTITTQNHNSAALQDSNFSIVVTKQGADAKTEQLAYTPEVANFFRGGEAYVTNTANDFVIGSGGGAYGTTSSATMTVNPNLEPMQISCPASEESTGSTCSSVEQFGFSFNQKVAGSTEVCAEFTTWSNGLSVRKFKWRETANNDDTNVLQEGPYHQSIENPSGVNRESIKQCHIFYFSTTGKKTVRLYAIGSGAGANIIADGTDNQAAKLSFRPIQHNVSRPVIQNMVDTSYSKGLRIEHCRITNAGTPTTSDPACSTWLTSLTDNGPGTTFLNFVSGTWSQPPSCFMEWNAAGQGFMAMDTLSIAGVQARTMNAAQASIDIDFNVMCVGVR